MRQARHTWRTVGLLVSGLYLGDFAITPAVAATITYTFSGIVRGIDSAQTVLLPFGTSAPLSRMSGSPNVFTTPQVRSESQATYFGSRIQLNVGSYQIRLPFRLGNHRATISNTDSSKASSITFTRDGLTLTPNSSVNSWLNQASFNTLEGPPSAFSSTEWPRPLGLSPSISTLSHSREWRLPFNNNPAPTDPVTLVQGTIAPSTIGPLPASLIIAGVGLVALIGLGAGGLRAS